MKHTANEMMAMVADRLRDEGREDEADMMEAWSEGNAPSAPRRQQRPIGGLTLIGGASDGEVVVSDRSLPPPQIRMPVYPATVQVGESDPIQIESFELERLVGPDNVSHAFYRHSSLSLNAAVQMLLRGYAPSNQFAEE